MYTIAYSKSSKKIVHARYDLGPQVAFDFYFKEDCRRNGLNPDDYVCIEHPYDDNLIIVLGNHVFNEATGQIEEDPNYVAPTPAPITPAEPTV